MEKTTEAKDKIAQTTHKIFPELDDCNTYKRLAEFIEGSPVYKVMSRDLFDPKDFHAFVGNGITFPAFGITEPINIENMPHPKTLYNYVKLRFLELNKRNPVKSVNFPEDPINGLQYIVQLCYEAASEQKKEAEQITSDGNAGDGKNGGQSIDSQNKQEDIIEFKPNVCGIGLNINALIRKKKWGIKIKNLLKAFIYRTSLHK